jgi:hypothetical protein
MCNSLKTEDGGSSRVTSYALAAAGRSPSISLTAATPAPPLRWPRAAFTEIARARSALWSLNPGTARPTWVKSGMGAKAAGLDFDDFHTWSATAPNYKSEADCRSVWNSFKDGAVTAASLFAGRACCRLERWRRSASHAPTVAPGEAPATRAKQTRIA